MFYRGRGLGNNLRLFLQNRENTRARRSGKPSRLFSWVEHDVNNATTRGREETGKGHLLTHYNDVFQYQVDNKWEVKEWVDQHGVSEDKKTPAQSIQERVHHIKTDIQETTISWKDWQPMQARRPCV